VNIRKSATGTLRDSDHDNRLEQIDEWWEGGFPGAFRTGSRLESRIRKAFSTVLLAIPDDDYDQFFQRPPTLVCQPETRACVFQLWLPRTPGDERGADAVIIYLNAPLLAKEREASLVRTIAHECAHFIRRDYLTYGVDNPSAGRDIEQGADDKSQSWGFGRAYSTRRLDREFGVDQRDKAARIKAR
jgi:hypothetical protein